MSSQVRTLTRRLTRHTFHTGTPTGTPAAWTRVRATTIGTATLIALLAVPVALAGQTTTGSIRGYVRGPNEIPIGEAQISARNVELGQTRNTLSNASGFYSIPGLRAGRYDVTIRRLGFTAQTRTVNVPIAQTLTLDVLLQPAATELATVTITAEAATQTARTSEVGTNVSEEQIRNLPTFDRNFLDLARLVPGITAQRVNDDSKFLAAGGQPAEAINIFVDGASYKNDVIKGGVVGQDASKGNPFPQAAVQEFRVITQNYKAEYQKASSAIITATTRSGGNQWEADVFAYGIGKAYVARNPIEIRNGTRRPDYERLQAGGSLGGPIVRDRLFFFGTYELNFRDQPQFVSLGGNAALAPPGLNPQQYAGSFTSEFREHLGFGKLTWLGSDRSTVEASVNLRRETDFRGFGGQTSFESAENVDVDVSTGIVNWRYAGDRWLNEAQVNFQRMDWNPSTANPGLIGRDYQGIIRIGGREGGQQFVQDRLSLRNDVTRSNVQLAGDHVFKAGAFVDFLSYEGRKQFFFNEPIYRFRAAEDYLRPFEATFGFGDPEISTNNTQIGLYIQDDWTVTPRLTLNLGLRWDVETNMINNSYVTPQPLADSLRGAYNDDLFVRQPLPDGTEREVRVIDQLGGLDRYITTGRDDREIYLGAFQPRLGASFDVTGDGRTVLFGGAGIYYDRNYWNTLFDEQFRRQYRQLTIRFEDTCAPNEFNCAVWQDRYFDPVQLRTLGFNTAPEVFMVANDLKPPKTHQFSGGIRQAVGTGLVTLSYNGIRGYNFMNFVRGSFALPPNYAAVFVTDDRVKTKYDAMQLQLERPLRPSDRWGGGIAYTLSRSQEQGQSTDLFWGFDARFPTVADRPWRRAPGNQTHAIAANAIVRLPWDMNLSSIVNLGSGLTITATDFTGGRGQYQQVTYVYQPPTRPFLGIGRVFANQNMDLRLEKGFSFGGAQRVSLSADLYNVFNSRNFGCYNGTINPPNEPPNVNFGRADCAAPGRRLQVGLRYGLQPFRSGASSGQ